MFFKVIRAQLDFYKQELYELERQNQNLTELFEQGYETINRKKYIQLINQHKKISKHLSDLYKEIKFLWLLFSFVVKLTYDEFKWDSEND